MEASTNPRVVKTSGVLHGGPRIDGTRISVFVIGESIRQGEQSIEAILMGFPDLSREQVAVALEYYDENSELMGYLRLQRDLTRQRMLEQSCAPVENSDE
ncbi:DUF433 domain-containing protein [Halomarina oriensis]|uniref:DUF433 domain-containing protein n=1 Tax=Halomarina oriensis TaxID=671145 RepID=A0A6B0GH32_9EURY|nr:DUF433 domain-containing protein [Halomarina oriensis]MWG34034.1 DUF433 domain-containing protein [Halomarina oriensis]